jgi:trk system potassium uptake protein TrkA
MTAASARARYGNSTVIDTGAGRESALARAGLRAVRGDSVVPSTLVAAGALRADVLVARRRDDEDNLVISLLAKKHFNIPRAIARVNDPATNTCSTSRGESTHWSHHRQCSSR